MASRPPGRAPPAGDDDADQTVEALSWLAWLEPDAAALVRVRSEGARWKVICWRFGISRPTAHRRWRYALGLIAWRLNGRPIPIAQSRREFIEQVRASETLLVGTRVGGAQ